METMIKTVCLFGLLFAFVCGAIKKGILVLKAQKRRGVIGEKSKMS